MIAQKDFIKAFQLILNKMLGKFIENIKLIDISLFFDVLYDITTHYDVEPFVVELLKQLSSRILKEINILTRIKKKTENKKDSGVIINKCFNIIRAITEKEKYVIKYIV